MKTLLKPVMDGIHRQLEQVVLQLGARDRIDLAVTIFGSSDNNATSPVPTKVAVISKHEYSIDVRFRE